MPLVMGAFLGGKLSNIEAKPDEVSRSFFVVLFFKIKEKLNNVKN